MKFSLVEDRYAGWNYGGKDGTPHLLYQYLTHLAVNAVVWFTYGNLRAAMIVNLIVIVVGLLFWFFMEMYQEWKMRDIENRYCYFWWKNGERRPRKWYKPWTWYQGRHQDYGMPTAGSLFLATLTYLVLTNMLHPIAGLVILSSVTLLTVRALKPRYAK